MSVMTQQSPSPPIKMRHQQKTISLETIPLLKMRTAESDETVEWERWQPIQMYSVVMKKWRPAFVIGITEHSSGYYLDIHCWESARSAETTAECLDAESDFVRPISSDLRLVESRADWTIGSQVECFSESRGRWYLATVVNVIREDADTEDWLELRWLIEHSPTERQVYGKELLRSSELIRHRYPHQESEPTVSNAMMIRIDTMDTTIGLDTMEEYELAFSETEWEDTESEEESGSEEE